MPAHVFNLDKDKAREEAARAWVRLSKRKGGLSRRDTFISGFVTGSMWEHRNKRSELIESLNECRQSIETST